MTLVNWGGMFADVRGGPGGGHGPYGFAMGMTDAGTPGGVIRKAMGLHAIAEGLHVHELHAPIVYLIGVDSTGVIHDCEGGPGRLAVVRRAVSEEITR